MEKQEYERWTTTCTRQTVHPPAHSTLAHIVLVEAKMNILLQNPKPLFNACKFELAEWLCDASHNFRPAYKPIVSTHTNTKDSNRTKFALQKPTTTPLSLPSPTAANLPNYKRNTAQNLITQPLLKNERANPIAKWGEKEITLLQMERP